MRQERTKRLANSTCTLNDTHAFPHDSPFEKCCKDSLAKKIKSTIRWIN